MKNLKTLAAMTGGAIILSIGYAIAVNDHRSVVTVDNDDGRSIRHMVSGDRGEFILREEGRTLEAHWRGDFELSDDGNSIASLDHSIEIELETDNDTKRVVFKDKNGDVKKIYYVDDDEQPEGAETDKTISNLFLQFLRASGHQSDKRVAALLKADGATAVLDELGFLESDHALRRYSVALSEQADLSTEQITELASRLTSIESDHDLRLALDAILENETISAEATPALINAANNIESDHDLRLLVEAFAERPLNDEAMNLAIGLFERIESDHDLRVAAQALLENSDLDAKQAAKLLRTAANEIESDHDMRLILTEIAPMYFKEKLLTDAWIDGFRSLESGHDQRLSIVTVAEEGGRGIHAWLTLITACEDIDSDHDRRLALQAIADEMDDSPELIAAYRTAAAMIENSSDRRRALEAVGDEDDD